jgi:hypothetical protein
MVDDGHFVHSPFGVTVLLTDLLTDVSVILWRGNRQRADGKDQVGS